MKKIKISEKELIEKIRNRIMETTTASAGSVERPLNEKLKGNQTKLDKNKDGKISRDDFKMLRKQKSLKEEMEKLISEKNFTIIKNKIDSIGSRQTGKFLIDYFIGRILGGLSSSDLPDTALFADGLDELEDMLVPDLTIEDATNAFIYAKDIANQMIEEEGGDLFGESEDLYESKKQILNSDKLMDKEINEMLKTRKGREKLKNAVKKLDEEKLKK